MLDKTTLRRVLVAVFLAEGIIKLAIYRAVSVWDGNVPALALLISPAVAAGLVAGSRAHFAVSERTFSRVVGALLLALGIRILISV